MSVQLRPGLHRSHISGLLTVIATATLLLAGARIGAVPAAPVEITLTQKDGTRFPARAYGDEWRNGYETSEGHTILQDTGDGDWYYATRDGAGNLLRSTLKPGRDVPASLPKHLRSGAEAGKSRAPHLDGKVIRPSLGSKTAFRGDQPLLVLLVYFTDRQPVGSILSAWQDRAFGMSDSLSDFYRTASYGSLNIFPAAEQHGFLNDGVVGWLQLNYPHPNPGGNTGDANRRLTRDAIIAADPYVNFAMYDTDSNGHISNNELLVMVIVAGYETSYGGEAATPNPSVWGHQWALGTGSVLAPVVDNVDVGHEDHGGSYMQFGEWHAAGNEGGHMATIGIMCHEMGHGLDMPDLYDTSGGSEGVGQWCIMGGGSWNKTTGYYGSSPALPCAFLKWYHGWLTPERIASAATAVQFQQVAYNPRVVQLLDNPGGVNWDFMNQSGTGEYFLLENRQRVGYDAGLPGSGLLIWHIDETRAWDNSANSVETRKLVDLEEADGLNHLDHETNSGDSGDPFPGSSSKTVFNTTTVPNSRLYGGADSRVAVSGISASGATMSANISFVQVSTPPNDQFASRTTISGSSGSATGSSVLGTKEAGEPNHAGVAGGASVWWQWIAPANGNVTLHTHGSSFDTLLAVYTGSAVGALSAVAANDDSNSTRTSQLTFAATAGQSYKIAVDGFGGATGQVSLNWNQEGVPCNYTVLPATATLAGSSATSTFALTTSSGCNWSAATSAAWLSITSASTGAGSSTITYLAAANPSSTPRTATITVQGQSHTVTQQGAVATTYLHGNQKVRIRSYGGGFQEIVFHYTTSQVSTTPYQSIDVDIEYGQIHGEWVGIFHYDYASGRFTQALYSMPERI